MKKLSQLLMGLFFLSGVSIASTTPVNGNGSKVDSSFSVDGNLIQPACVALFNQEKVSYPVIVGVDVNSCHSSNGIPHMTRKDGGVVYFLYQGPPSQSGNGYYGYQVIGRTTSGTYVLHSFSQLPGAKEVFDALLFITLDNQGIAVYSGANDPLKTKTTKMELTGYFVGGDRCSGGIKSATVSGNQVTVLKYPDINSVKQCEGATKSTIDVVS